MICTICTMDVMRGTMYRIHRSDTKGFRSGYVCGDCRLAVMDARAEEINEPLCECGKLAEWACRARLDKENCGAPK